MQDQLTEHNLEFPIQDPKSRENIITEVDYTVLRAADVRKEIEQSGFYSIPVGTKLEARIGIKTYPTTTYYYDLGEITTQEIIQASLGGANVNGEITLLPTNEKLREISQKLEELERKSYPLKRKLENAELGESQLTSEELQEIKRLRELSNSLFTKKTNESINIARQILDHHPRIQELANAVGITPDNLRDRLQAIEFIAKVDREIVSNFPLPPWQKMK